MSAPGLIAPMTLQLIFGIGTPLQLERESVIVGAFTKLIYALPSNASELTEPGVVYGREEPPRTSRWSLYERLAKLLELYGLGDGRSCVLRAICEAASMPFEHREGLLQRLLQTFLSPSSTLERHEEYRDREYEAAERLGARVGDNCHALYPECRTSFLDLFSSVRSLLLPESLE
ncbi:PREDICTED: uncharacterized protein LOC105363329 [Ceratosolen solmsi marchali]|uniref:Uncharacterized protein LOC105363329 n=1 Tax=Ceratosolen solmsi marchali TaxID=326594 RepID=A0AAJ6YJN7_9HYME|nr:PREDICTED: uncharacterized protein LOC105363329 [Ceratosolen solmsi marchali]